MSVYVSLTLAELRHFLRFHDLGEIQHLEGIAEGVVNTNYRVITSRGCYVLTLVEDPLQGEALPHVRDLMAHLAHRDIPCPLPVADRHGDTIHRLKDRPTLLVTHLPGQTSKHADLSQCAQVGTLLARIHQCSAGFSRRRPNPMGPSRWQQLLDHMAPLLEMSDPTTLALLRGGTVMAQRAFFSRSLPEGILHGDLFPDNVLVEGNLLTGVIDFHFSCHGPLIYDLAIALAAWCFNAEGVLDENRQSAILEGYTAVRLLCREERQGLDLALRVANLRFAVTRLHDAFFPRQGDQVTRKDPEAFLRRLRKKPGD